MTGIYISRTRISQSHRLGFYNLHTSCAQGSKGDLKSNCTRPEVTQLVEVYQIDPG